MVPEVIDWEAVRCVSIEGTTIRFVEREVQHEIVFPDEAALNTALKRWTSQSRNAPVRAAS